MTTYTVKPGDTLAQISEELYGDWTLYPILANYNGIPHPDLIKVGQVLHLPPWLPRKARYPLDEERTDYYTYGTPFASGPWKGKPHPGVDFHEACGAPVYAVGDGYLEQLGGDTEGYGLWCMLRHLTSTGERRWTLYAHLERFEGDARAGMLIRHGQVLGYEGESGASGGVCHLHFEVKKTDALGLYPGLTYENLNEQFIDPYVWLEGVKLVPLEAWG